MAGLILCALVLGAGGSGPHDHAARADKTASTAGDAWEAVAHLGLA